MIAPDFVDKTDASIAVEIEDGKLSMSDSDRDGDLHIKTPSSKPLSKTMMEMKLKATTDDTTVTVELSAKAVDALADAIYHLRD